MADSPTPPAAPPPGGTKTAAAANPAAMDPRKVIRSPAYLSALILAAILGIPISAVAYGFLTLVSKIQTYLFTTLPHDVLGGTAPAWWPIPWLVLCGLLTGLTIRYLPGNCGHSPPLASIVCTQPRTHLAPSAYVLPTVSSAPGNKKSSLLMYP